MKGDPCPWGRFQNNCPSAEKIECLPGIKCLQTWERWSRKSDAYWTSPAFTSNRRSTEGWVRLYSHYSQFQLSDFRQNGHRWLKVQLEFLTFLVVFCWQMEAIKIVYYTVFPFQLHGKALSLYIDPLYPWDRGFVPIQRRDVRKRTFPIYVFFNLVERNPYKLLQQSELVNKLPVQAYSPSVHASQSLTFVDFAKSHGPAVSFHYFHQTCLWN